MWRTTDLAYFAALALIICQRESPIIAVIDGPQPPRGAGTAARKDHLRSLEPQHEQETKGEEIREAAGEETRRAGESF